MTRVLIVLASNERRGAEVEGAQLADELCRKGYVAEAVALRAGEHPSLDLSIVGPAPLALATLRALRRKAAAFDVVIAYGSTSLPACAIALLGSRIPFVYRSIGDPRQWVRGRFHQWRTGLLFHRAAQVVALWPGAAGSITQLYRVAPARVSCIANARPVVETDSGWSRAAARAALGLPADGTVVAWVGRLSEEKRPMLAVQAVAELDDGFLVIAGDGPLLSDLTSACERLLPGRHKMLGVVPLLAPLWTAADVVLLTSRTEGIPGVLIEAGLHGVPAVATDVGGVGLVVADGKTGRLICAGASAADFADAMHDVVAHRAEFGAAARRRVEGSFTWASVLPDWLLLLDRVRSQRRRPRSP